MTLDELAEQRTMDINEFLIQATLASIRAGKIGALAACDAISAAKLLIDQTRQMFHQNDNLAEFRKKNNHYA